MRSVTGCSPADHALTLLLLNRVEIDEKQLPEMLQQALAAARKRGALEDDDDGDAEESEEDPMAGGRLYWQMQSGSAVAVLWHLVPACTCMHGTA